MAGVRLTDEENPTLIRALDLYAWYLSLPEHDRPRYWTLTQRSRTEEETDLILTRQMRDRAYLHEMKKAGYL